MHFASIPLSVTALSLVLAAVFTNAIDSNNPDSALNNGQIRLFSGSSIVCNDQGCFEGPFGGITLAAGRDDRTNFQNDSSIECGVNGCVFIPSRVRLPKDSSIVCNDQGCFTIPSADITMTAMFKPLSFSKDSSTRCNSHGCTVLPADTKIPNPSPTASSITPTITRTGHGPIPDSTTVCHGNPPVCTVIPAAIVVGKDRPTIICSNSSPPSCVSVPAALMETSVGPSHPSGGVDSTIFCNNDHPPVCEVIPAATVETTAARPGPSSDSTRFCTHDNPPVCVDIPAVIVSPRGASTKFCNNDNPPVCVDIPAATVKTPVSSHHPPDGPDSTVICEPDDPSRCVSIPAATVEPEDSDNAGTHPRDEL